MGHTGRAGNKGQVEMIFPNYEQAREYAKEQEKEGMFCTFKGVLEGIEVTCEYSFGTAPTMAKVRPRISREGKQKFFEAPVPVLPVEPYQYQQQAIDAIIARKKGTVVLPTGRGKTLVGIAFIERVQEPTLIIVPTLPLLVQWIDELKKAQITATAVSGTEKKFGRVTVTTYQSAILNLGILKTYPIIIIDEVHHLYAPEFVRILDTVYATSGYIIGLTATAIEEGQRGYTTQQRLLPVIYKKTLGEFQAGPTGVPIEIFDIGVKLSPGEMEEYEAYTRTILAATRSIGSPEKWPLVKPYEKNYKLARKALSFLPARQKLLSTLPEKMDKAAQVISQNPGQFIVFTESIPAVVALYDKLTYMSIPSIRFDSAMDYTLQQKAEVLRDFKAGKYRVLIGIRTIEEGLDIPDVSQAIFLATTRSNPRYIVQRLGRILRYRPGKTAKLWYIYADGTIEQENLKKVGNILEY